MSRTKPTSESPTPTLHNAPTSNLTSTLPTTFLPPESSRQSISQIFSGESQADCTVQSASQHPSPGNPPPATSRSNEPGHIPASPVEYQPYILPHSSTSISGTYCNPFPSSPMPTTSSIRHLRLPPAYCLRSGFISVFQFRFLLVISFYALSFSMMIIIIWDISFTLFFI